MDNNNILSKHLDPKIEELKKETEVLNSEVEKPTEDTNHLDDSVEIVKNSSVEELIKLRKNPEPLVIVDQARIFENIIKEEGLIPWLEKRLNTMFLGNKKNIYRKMLACFNIARGYDSCFSSTTGDSGTGKTFEDETTLKYLTHPLYYISMNAPTYAAFTREGMVHEEYYNRAILSVGDIGHKSDLEEFLPIAKVYQILITEKEYSRKVTAPNNKSTIELKLKTESCGCFYCTTTTIAEIDKQIESRALKSTPYSMNEKEVMDFNDRLRVSFSKESIAKAEAIDKLKLFRNYLLWKICDDTEIINPWGSVFNRYVKNTSATIREHNQINNLFDGYCKLTYYDCDRTVDGKLVASEKQLTEFLEYIALENAMQPNNYNFLTLIKSGGGRKNKEEYEMVLLNESNIGSTCNDLNYYINDILEQMDNNPLAGSGQTYLDHEDSYKTLESLNDQETKRFNKLLIKQYGLDRIKGGVFFTITQINNAFRSYKPYKDLIEDVSQVLYNLYLDNYLGKLDSLHNGKSIYYLTKKCEDLDKPISITDGDRNFSKDFTTSLGLKITKKGNNSQ